MEHQVKIAVRPLVEYVYRSGSIDARFRSSTSLTEGTKAHQKVQNAYEVIDEHEVFLQTQIETNGILFIIEGRCDGIIHRESGIIIDEIKSSARDLENIEENSYPVHWAQAKLYAYMYSKQNALKGIHVQLTYFHVNTEEKKQFIQFFTHQELEDFIYAVIEKYSPFAEMMLKHEKARDQSIKELAFPFKDFRQGQRLLSGALYKSVKEGKNLFVKAPTGIGKTISTTFPAVKAIQEGMIKKIFYLTAKTITREAAENAFSLMHAQGLQLHSVTLTAKDKICFTEKGICSADECEFANGYYDRVNGALIDIMSNETLLTRRTIEEYARKHHVCPFEYSLDISYLSDAVICDYNYVFDPRVSLKRFIDEQKKKTALLIDEAHNLVDRGRDMYSASLYKSPFLQLKKEYTGKNKHLFEAVKKVNTFFLQLKKDAGEENVKTMENLPAGLVPLLESFSTIAEQELMENRGLIEPNLLESYFAVQAFLKAADFFDERFACYFEINRGEMQIKILCLDPSFLLKKFGKGFRSKVFFSATFIPIDYYREMLGGEMDDLSLSVGSPFSPEQTDVFIYPLSTRFHDRQKTKKSIAKMINDLVTERPGNCFVFFPSFAYLNDVYDEFTESFPGVKTIFQRPQMGEEEREAFLNMFLAEGNQTVVGFAVLGGIFSEGIDLKGDRLRGVVVVGVGLPQIGLERNMIKDYFSKTGRNGYDYSYLIPGMNKVLQAGGRLIRSEEDHGTIVLVDDRFLHTKYQQLLPMEWADFQIIR